MSGEDDKNTRGPGFRRALVMDLPVPDLAKDKGGALVVDTSAIDLDADEIAEPLSAMPEVPPKAGRQPEGPSTDGRRQ